MIRAAWRYLSGLVAADAGAASDAIKWAEDSTLAGTHSDSIRTFLNMLVGRQANRAMEDSPDEGDDGWMDLGDEGEDRGLDAETRRLEAEANAQSKDAEGQSEQPNGKPVDPRQFERMVRAYTSNITSGSEALGSADVLRLRFWLMMLLYKARHPTIMRIFEFAIVTEWEGRLQTLAQIAEPERWNYLYAPSYQKLQILDNYVRHTFTRAYDQQKMIEGDGMVAFNTGLLTPGQEEIFGVFTLSDYYNPEKPAGDVNKKWFLKYWARSGERILTDLREFPPLVEYWFDPKDLIFDPKLEVSLNLDHIVRENLNRFPEELGGRVDSNNVPTDLSEDAGNLELESPEESPTDSPVPLATRNALEGAMKNSIRLAQRSYRIAVPQFYHDKIQLLLPLYLRDSTRPDLALTLERHGGWYRAATVLYPDWAYSHARLLARPNSEWLGGFRTDLVATELKVSAKPRKVDSARGSGSPKRPASSG